jgi:hypothetical protein
MTAPIIKAGPVLTRIYETSAGTNTFTPTGSPAVGDLLVAHVANGSSPTGGTESITNASGTAWTKFGAFDNGRCLFYKTVTAQDIGVVHTLNNFSSSYGLIYWVFSNATLNTSLSGAYSPLGPAGPATKDCVVSKIYYNSGVTRGDFPNVITTDGSNNVEWKNFTAGQTLQNYTSAAANWHATSNLYKVLVVDSPNVPPNAPTGLAVSNSPVPLGSSANVNWTFSDPDAGQTQQAYQLRWRRTGN